MGEAAAGSMGIGDFSRATGVAVGTLRMWESRHGFPRSERTAAGHRRYAADQVARVLEVARRRDEGMRLAAAIAVGQSAPGEMPSTPSGSLYATLSRDFPAQPRQRLRKSTLLGLSWACEDELAATATGGYLFGAFQTEFNFDHARDRWSELARTARSTFAMADFSRTGTSEDDRIERVALPPQAPMRREWAVVNDSPGLPIALTAWEVPGQRVAREKDRLFESVWTMDPRAVRAAARLCSDVAAAAGSERAAELKAGPLSQPAPAEPDLLAVTRLAHRMVAYVETASRP